MGLGNVTKTVTTQNSFGTVKSYDITGPKLKDVLAALGADMAAVNADSVLQVKCTDPADPASANYNHFLINSNDSILALTVNGSTSDAPRLFPAVETGKEYSDSSKAIKMVDTLALAYN
jgi:NAD(P)H-nitrite reductase large subunit